MLNLYALLGLSQDASQEEIAQALAEAEQNRKISVENAKFVREFLLDAEKKAEYDKTLHTETTKTQAKIKTLPNFYYFLNIKATASEQEIAQALAQAEKNDSISEKTAALVREFLLNADKRVQYDQELRGKFPNFFQTEPPKKEKKNLGIAKGEELSKGTICDFLHYIFARHLFNPRSPFNICLLIFYPYLINSIYLLHIRDKIKFEYSYNFDFTHPIEFFGEGLWIRHYVKAGPSNAGARNPVQVLIYYQDKKVPKYLCYCPRGVMDEFVCTKKNFNASRKSKRTFIPIHYAKIYEAPGYPDGLITKGIKYCRIAAIDFEKKSFMDMLSENNMTLNDIKAEHFDKKRLSFDSSHKYPAPIK